MVILQGEQTLPEPKRRIKSIDEESANIDPKVKKSKTEDFLICDDCMHNTITYEPSNEGTCFCGCH